MSSQPIEYRKRVLHISDLDPSISPEDLLRAVRQEGFMVEYANVHKGRKPDSLSWADVGFADEDNAARALEALNHLTLGRTEINIMYRGTASPGSRFGFDPRRNVFVKQIPTDVSTIMLQSMFAEIAGPVENIRLPRGLDNKIRGYGYVLFETEEAARKAIEQSGKDIDIEIEGNDVDASKETRTFKFEIQPYIPYAERTRSWTNMYVRGFPQTWTEEKLRAFVEQFGKIMSIKLVTRADHPDPYAFINFSSHEEAEKFGELDGKAAEDDGESFTWYIRQHESREVRRSHSNLLARRGCNVFITNFPPGTTQGQMEGLFSRFGKIFSAVVFDKPIHGKCTKNYPRSYIMFVDPESAQRAIQEMNGSDALQTDQYKEELLVAAYQTHKSAIGSSFGKPVSTTSAPMIPQASAYGHAGMMITGPGLIPDGSFMAPIPMPFGAVPAAMPALVESPVHPEVVSDELYLAIRNVLPELVEEAVVETKAAEIMGILREVIDANEMPRLLNSADQLKKYVEALIKEEA